MKLNDDTNVDGLLVQLPLPGGLGLHARGFSLVRPFWRGLPLRGQGHSAVKHGPEEMTFYPDAVSTWVEATILTHRHLPPWWRKGYRPAWAVAGIGILWASVSVAYTFPHVLPISGSLTPLHGASLPVFSLWP